MVTRATKPVTAAYSVIIAPRSSERSFMKLRVDEPSRKVRRMTYSGSGVVQKTVLVKRPRTPAPYVVGSWDRLTTLNVSRPRGAACHPNG
jgi:hypothetical protein